MARASSHRIAIVGDFRGTPAQVATADALNHAASALGVGVDVVWLATRELQGEVAARVRSCAGLFIAPGSPYENVAGVLAAIQVARVERIPLLGTCGGFQHVVLEHARTVLRIPLAQHAEYDASAPDVVIAPLACPLVGTSGEVFFEPRSQAEAIYEGRSCVEEYRCSYGLVPSYEQRLVDAGLAVSGRDGSGEARVIELSSHPFFMATLYVPQLASRAGKPHPLITALVTSSSFERTKSA